MAVQQHGERRERPRRLIARAILLTCWVLGLATDPSRAVTLPPNFQERVIFEGLVEPTAVRFAPDGRVFVAEKRGTLIVFDDTSDPAGDLVVDLRDRIDSIWDRGLLGLAVHPDFPATPYVFALYTHNFDPYTPDGGEPRWPDGCPDPPGASGEGCVVNGRLSRFVVGPDNGLVGDEHVLIEGRWCQQAPTHSIGDLVFDHHGALYISAGDGASFSVVDYGQVGGGPGAITPANPCEDPPGPRGVAPTPPTAEGGALRSQDLRTPGDPTSYMGAVLRIDPLTGAAWPTNPLLGGDPDDDRVLAHGLRNPFRMALRPESHELWIGDVGWVTWEEINRVPHVDAGALENFGWPCYEGPERQAGYDAANLAVCEDLYLDAQAPATAPFYAYRQGDPIDPLPGEPRCSRVGSSSITGLAFYDGQAFPEAYHGALFFADFARRCLFVMSSDGEGLPDLATRRTFAEGVWDPVDLQMGPDGFLYYVDLPGGRVRRIEYDLTTRAVASANPPHGPVPLNVQFDAAASGGIGLTYAWDLDGDGDFDDSTAINLARTYDVPGVRTVGLRVTAADGSSDTTTTVVTVGNAAPQVTILEPSPDRRWAVGESIAFRGRVTDLEAAEPLTFTWTFPACAAPSTANGANVEAVVFACPPGAYDVQVEVCDSLQVCDVATQSVTVLPGPCVPLGPEGLSVVFVDSEELVGEPGAAIHAIDGNPASRWVTGWSAGSPPHPHELQVDLGSTYQLCAVSYLPRQDGGSNGTIRDFEIEVSLDGGAWYAAASGRWVDTPADLTERTTVLSPAPARFVRIRTLNSVNAQPWASAAEFRFHAAPATAPFPPRLTIDTPAIDVGVGVGESRNFTATADDFDGQLPLQWNWTFPSCATPSSSTVEDPGPVQFDCPPARYGVVAEVCDAGSACSRAERTITVIEGGCPVLDPVAWQIVFRDSEEVVGENGAATHAIDGNPGTYWVTRWLNGVAQMPHELRVDLGALHVLCGFSYLPRQDGGNNGHIREFQFATSLNGSEWAPLAEGILVEPGSGVHERPVELRPVTARYVRLTALSESRGGPWAAMAELRLFGAPAGDDGLPVAWIVGPVDTAGVVATGESLDFASAATAGRDGELPATALRWDLLIHHCPGGPSDCHVHPVESQQGVDEGSFVAPDHSWYSFLEVRLSGLDEGLSDGTGQLTGQRSVFLDPLAVTLEFQTEPPGLDLALGGTQQTAPFAATVIVGSANSLSAPSPQTTGDVEYAFIEWSQAGPISQVILAPPAPATYVAQFEARDDCVSDDPTCDGFDDDCDGSIDDDAVLPVAPIELRVERGALNWTAVDGATAYDVLRGDLGALQTGLGDFAAAISECLASATAGSAMNHEVEPEMGAAWFYLVRASNCAGPGSYDAGSSPVAPRDGSIAEAAEACP